MNRCANIRESPPCPGPAAAGGPCRRRGGRSSCSARRGTGQPHDHPARRADSCDSTGPPARRGRFVPCWCARLILESTLTDQSSSQPRPPREQRPEHPVPRAVPAEPAVPLPHRLRRPEPLRQVPPRDPGPEPAHGPLHHSAAPMHETVAPFTVRGRHQRSDRLPLGSRSQHRTRYASAIGDAHPEVGRHSLDVGRCDPPG